MDDFDQAMMGLNPSSSEKEETLLARAQRSIKGKKESEQQKTGGSKGVYTFDRYKTQLSQNKYSS